MHVKITSSAMISNFLNVGFNSYEICQLVESEANKMIHNVNNENLKDWRLRFLFSYTNGTQIIVSKRTKSETDIKYKEIVAHIPIPLKDKISWGVELSQHVYKDERYLDNIIHNFYSLKIDFTNYKNRHDYILDSMRRVVNFAFKNGFTINGIRIKVENL